MAAAPEHDLLPGCPVDPACPPEWVGITERRHNVLLEARPEATDSALRTLLPYLAEPIVRRRPGEPLELGRTRGTLILDEVATLPVAEQARLRGWLDAAYGRVQVISTSSRAIFPLVSGGLFDETLYYRLNAVRLASWSG